MDIHRIAISISESSDIKRLIDEVRIRIKIYKDSLYSLKRNIEEDKIDPDETWKNVIIVHGILPGLAPAITLAKKVQGELTGEAATLHNLIVEGNNLRVNGKKEQRKILSEIEKMMGIEDGESEYLEDDLGVKLVDLLSSEDIKITNLNEEVKKLSIDNV